jgi:hypothetical protein
MYVFKRNFNMPKRDPQNLIKNVYDDSTIDTIRQMDQNITALMHHNPDFKDVELTHYERMPVKPGSPQSQIRVDVSRKDKTGYFFLSEDLITKLEESNNIRNELQSILKKIQMALLSTKS